VARLTLHCEAPCSAMLDAAARALDTPMYVTGRHVVSWRLRDGSAATSELDVSPGTASSQHGAFVDGGCLVNLSGDDSAARLSDRYELLFKLASGGMGSVFVGRARGALGFRQLVAIKLPHPHVLEDPNVRTVLVNEARVASSIRHANVASVRDVEVAGEQVLLVMDYVEGGALSELMASTKGAIDTRLSLRIVLDACAGLQAAHEATDDRGRALDVVHRDVSPQNILVGLDGLARVTDFGVAKCASASIEPPATAPPTAPAPSTAHAPERSTSSPAVSAPKAKPHSAVAPKGAPPPASAPAVAPSTPAPTPPAAPSASSRRNPYLTP